VLLLINRHVEKLLGKPSLVRETSAATNARTPSGPDPVGCSGATAVRRCRPRNAVGLFGWLVGCLFRLFLCLFASCAPRRPYCLPDFVRPRAMDFNGVRAVTLVKSLVAPPRAERVLERVVLAPELQQRMQVRAAHAATRNMQQ
jgi:hypothetical protein